MIDCVWCMLVPIELNRCNRKVMAQPKHQAGLKEQKKYPCFSPVAANEKPRLALWHCQSPLGMTGLLCSA